MKRRDLEKPQESQDVPRTSDSKVDDITGITHSSASDKNSIPACSTRVNPSRKHGIGPLGGPREVWGVRIDKELKKRVAPKLRRAFGSDCRAFESWLMAFEVLYDETIRQRGEWVNPGHTNVVIEGGLHVVRAQRPRRKLEVDDPIGYSVEENAVVEETVNRFEERHEMYEAIPQRKLILYYIRDFHPKIDGKTRISLTSRIMKRLAHLMTVQGTNVTSKNEKEAKNTLLPPSKLNNPRHVSDYFEEKTDKPTTKKLRPPMEEFIIE